MTFNKYPIEGLFQVEIRTSSGEIKAIDYNKLEFLEWVYVKEIKD